MTGESIPRADDPWLGQTLAGKYRLDERLGEGGFGTAYLAADLNYAKLMGGNRHVVVKLPRLDRLGDGRGVPKDFRKEAHALTTLEHAHIVKVLDVGTQTVTHLGQEREIPFLVLQYASGKSLEDRLVAQGGIQSLDEVLGWLPDVARALDYLHAQVPPVLHRDVKPGNILFDAAGSALLADFGIAKIFGAGSVTGGLPGSPLYMAPDPMLVPERADGGSEVLDGRYDQYALAVTVYEALSGHLPHEPTAWANGKRSSVDEHVGARLVFRKTTEAPTPLRTHAPHVSATVAAAVERALACKRDDRYPSCVDFGRAFVDAARKAEKRPPSAQPPPPPSTPPPSPRSTRRWPLAVGAIAVAAAAATIAFGRPAPAIEEPTFLIVETPSDDALVSANEMRVSGQAIGPTDAVLVIDGKPVLIRDGKFSKSIPAGEDGTRTLEVAFGPLTAPRRRVERRRVVVDRTKPRVEITRPVDRSIPFDATTVTIEGRVADAHLGELTVGLTTIPVTSDDGAFVLNDVQLPAGPTPTIRLSAVDRGGLASDEVPVVFTRRPKPDPSWKKSLDAAIAAVAARDWATAKERLSEARDAGLPAAGIPAELAVGVRAYEALAAADALARRDEWVEAEKALPTAPLPAGLSVPAFVAAGLRPASVALRSPVDGSRSATFDVVVAGVLEGRASDRVSCRGRVYAPGGGGEFSFTVTLSEYGTQSIDVRAVDGRGAPRSEPVRVSVEVVDTRPATLTIESPAEGDVLYADSVKVSGRIQTTRSSDVVEVGGKAARVTGERFEAFVPRSGANSINVVVKDGSVQRARASVIAHWFDGPVVPDFRVNTIDGDDISPSKLRGSWFVLEWISPLCDVTRDSYAINGLQPVQSRWSQRGVKWYVVSSTPEGKKGYLDTAAWTAWKSKYGVEAATLIVDRFGELERAFSVRDTRTAIVVDPSGRILHRGAIDNHDALRRARSNTSPHVSGAIVDVVYEDIPNATEVATSFADVVLTEAFARRTLAYPSGVVLPTGWG